MEPMYNPEPIIYNSHMVRPGQRRDRLTSDVYRPQQLYYQDNNGLLVPAGPAGGGRVHTRERSSSMVEAPRPSQIVINNEFENHSPQRSPHGHRRHASRGRDYRDDSSTDDSFDERPRSHRRHRRHSKHRRTPSRSPEPHETYNFEFERMKNELDDMKRREHRKEEEERARERYEQEKLIEEAHKAQKKKEEEALRKKAIDEYNIKQKEEKQKKDEEEKKAEEEYKKRLEKDLKKSGIDEEEIKAILKGKEKIRHEQHEQHHGHHGSHGIVDLRRPTFIRVNCKHLSPETLDIYDLPWDWDEHDPEFIIIKRWVPEPDQQILFEHTRNLRARPERKQIMDTPVELKKERDKMYLVRKKSPARAKSRPRSWMFT